MKVKKIDHISIAVRDLNKAREAYENILGLELDSIFVSDEEKIKVARYRIGDIWLELMEPTETGDVSKFLDRKGEGIMVISYEVPNVEQTIAELKSKGYKLIDDKPRFMLGSRYAFINHPKELCGVLTEIWEYER